MSTSSMEEALYPAIADIIQADYPGSIVTHFTAIVAIIADDGTEMVLTLDRPEQTLHQTMGLIDFTREMRRALIAQQVCEHEEEEED